MQFNQSKVFYCQYFQHDVELSSSREKHIVEAHPDLLPDYETHIKETIFDPDQIRSSLRFQEALLFCRWCETLKRGKFLVVVVVTEYSPQQRHWIITAYISKKLTHGKIIWKKN